jgi:hypothetical protein
MARFHALLVSAYRRYLDTDRRACIAAVEKPLGGLDDRPTAVEIRLGLGPAQRQIRLRNARTLERRPEILARGLGVLVERL